jgi:uncharacterized protein YdaU (DUF1376 family)
VNYYPRYPADYAAKTLHLSLAEDGAYTRLLDWMYANERPILHENRFRIARATDAKERKIVDRVLNEFFRRDGDAWTHVRVSEEIAHAAPKIAAARQNGKKGGRPPKNPMGFDGPQETKPSGFPEQNPVGFQNKTHKEPTAKAPQNQNHKSKSKDQKPCAAGAARFPEFWAAYPRHEARKQALEIWQRKRLDDQTDALVADVERRKREHRPWREGFVPHAVVYLRNERWDDAIDSGETTAGEVPAYLAGAM